ERSSDLLLRLIEVDDDEVSPRGHDALNFLITEAEDPLNEGFLLAFEGAGLCACRYQRGDLFIRSRRLLGLSDAGDPNEEVRCGAEYEDEGCCRAGEQVHRTGDHARDAF